MIGNDMMMTQVQQMKTEELDNVLQDLKEIQNVKNEHDASDIDDEPHDAQLNVVEYQDIDQLVKVGDSKIQ